MWLRDQSAKEKTINLTIFALGWRGAVKEQLLSAHTLRTFRATLDKAGSMPVATASASASGSTVTFTGWSKSNLVEIDLRRHRLGDEMSQQPECYHLFPQ